MDLPKRDALAEIVAAIRSELGGGEPFWRLVEHVVRREIGGATVYIKRDAAKTKAAKLGAAIAQGQSIAAAFRAAGVSHATGYRMLKRCDSVSGGGGDVVDLVTKVAVKLSIGVRDPGASREIIEKCLHGSLADVLSVRTRPGSLTFSLDDSSADS